jgi:predicted nucleic acid-binding protein
VAILLDTSIFVEAERRGLRLEQMVELLVPNEDIATSAITVAELLFGVHGAANAQQSRERVNFVESIIERVPSLPFDVLVARVYAELWAALRQTGNLIAPHDLMIGSVALANHLDVLTHNIRDFGRIPGLTVRQPSW